MRDIKSRAGAEEAATAAVAAIAMTAAAAIAVLTIERAASNKHGRQTYKKYLSHLLTYLPTGRPTYMRKRTRGVDVH